MASAARITGTAVVISHFCPSDEDWTDLWPDRLERQRLQRKIADAQVLLVMFQVFVEIKSGGVASRIGGTKWGTLEISLTADTTNTLVEAAYDGRHHLGDLYGDLKIAGVEVSRWDLYAAPFRLELAKGLSTLLSLE